MSHSPRWMLAFAIALLPFGCSSSDGPVASGRDAGQEAGSGGATADGGAKEVTCGAARCTLPKGGGIERLTPCCTDTGGCGLKLANVSKCLPPDLPGTGSAPECPSPGFKTPGGDALGKCCGPSGCGALDPFLGCIPGPDFGAPARSCVYDPKNDCSSLVGISCDGAEDCTGGKRCCGKFQGNAYTEFGCFDSCAALVDGGSQFQWFELCHASDECENQADSCLSSTILPAPLSRCGASGSGTAAPAANAAAGHVNCGSSLCGAGEKCCIRTPHAPYCARANEPCECHPQGLGDGGPADSGTTADAALDGRTAPTDARAD